MADLNQLLKHTARTLYLSAKLLPPTIRPAFCTAYLLCRYADTIADTPLLPPEKRLAYVKQFPQWVLQKNPQAVNELTQQICSAKDTQHEENLLRNFPDCLAALDQLPTQQQAAILQVVQAVCHGMEIDLQTFPPETAQHPVAFSQTKELENYCHLMGGAPGIFWSQLIVMSTVLAVPADQFCQWGQDLGDALQIVNILRDLPRDLRISRCYFPQEELQPLGLSAADLLRPENAPAFEPIKQKWIAWGRRKLSSAHAYFTSLPKMAPRHRTAVAWPVLWAADTLNKLEQAPNLLDPAVRVKIPRARIYGTMACTLPILLSDTLFSAWLKNKFPDGK